MVSRRPAERLQRQLGCCLVGLAANAHDLTSGNSNVDKILKKLIEGMVGVAGNKNFGAR